MTKIYLEVAFKEKDDAKSLGAQFDWAKKQWYVLEQDDLSLFQRWLPKEQPLKIEAEAQKDHTPHRSHYTIRQLKSEIHTAIKQAFPSAIWIVGEIIKITPKHGHLYLELQDDEALSAVNKRFTLRVNIWKNEVNTIQGKLKLVTGRALSISQRVRLKVRIEFNGQYGLSGMVIDIDPELTLGQIALEQKRIREKLIKEGIFEQNKNLSKPVDFCRVAVIHPDNASGFHDFKHIGDQLTNVCEFIYIPSRFEGDLVSKEMQAAFANALELHQASPLDALVIIRGGGARQGLLTLITENIIRLIATFPAPVIVGVGHTDDKLLIDEVANIACGTPSKVIEYIVQTIVSEAALAQTYFNQIMTYSDNVFMMLTAKIKEYNMIIKSKVSGITTIYTNELIANLNIIKRNADKQIVTLGENIINNITGIRCFTQKNVVYLNQHILQSAGAINSIASIKMENYKTTILQYKNSVINGAQNKLINYQETIHRHIGELKNNVLRQQSRIEEKLKNSFGTIELLSPEKTLVRGYCLSIGKTGVIKSLVSAKKETIFMLRFSDGESQVKLIEEK